MGLFGKSRKEKEREYYDSLHVPECMREDCKLIIEDVFTIIGTGTVVTGLVRSGMCRVGETAHVVRADGTVLESKITKIDIHATGRRSNNCIYKGECGGIALRGISKEQISKGDVLVVRNANIHSI